MTYRVHLRPWYKVLLALWTVLVLPAIVLSFGFAGGFPEVPSLRNGHLIDLIFWLAGVAVFILPLLLAPIGIAVTKGSGFRSSGEHE